jgi:hypothetical protein
MHELTRLLTCKIADLLAKVLKTHVDAEALRARTNRDENVEVEIEQGMKNTALRLCLFQYLRSTNYS